MTEEADGCRNQPTLAPRDLPLRTGDVSGGSGSASGTHQHGHQHEAESIVCTVIEQLAEALDEDPTAMRPPIGDVIDPEILVLLQRTGERSEQTYTFTYRGYEVRVTSNGAVSVRRQPPNRST